MKKQINYINKSDDILIIEPQCDKYDHSSINTILSIIIIKLSKRVEFLGLQLHNKILKEILKKLKINNLPKFIRLGFFKKIIYIPEILYLINLFHAFFVIKNSQSKKIIFTTIDYKIFPILFILYKKIFKDKKTYFFVIHKGLRIFNNNRFISRVWEIIFLDPKINFIFLDKNCNKPINKFKNIISDHERINILNCKDVEFNINPKEKNTINKIFCHTRDYKNIIEDKSKIYNFSLIQENDKYLIKTIDGKKIEFLIINIERTISLISYLKKLNQCQYVLVNKSRENSMFTSGLRTDGLWAKKIIIEF